MQTPRTTWVGWRSYSTCSEVRLRTWIPQEEFLHIPWPHHLWESRVPEACLSNALGNLGPCSNCRMKQRVAGPSCWWLLHKVPNSLLLLMLHVKLCSPLRGTGADVPPRTQGTFQNLSLLNWNRCLEEWVGSQHTLCQVNDYNLINKVYYGNTDAKTKAIWW